MELITHKVLTMVLTGVVPLLLGLIPWSVGRRYCNPDNVRHQRIVSVLLCYGGGVLLGLSLLHLLPEVREFYKRAFGKNYGGPLAEFVLITGFIVIYLIEEIVHKLTDPNLQHNHCQLENHAPSINLHKTFSTARGNCNAGEVAEVAQTHEGECQSLLQPSQETSSSTTSGYQTFDDNSDVSSNQSAVRTSTKRVKFAPPKPSSIEHTEHFVSTFVRDLLTCLALSFHAVFEGMAIGLADNTVSLWTLYAGVAMHRYILAFCIGLELFCTVQGKHQNPFKVNLVFLFIFAAMSPLGIGLGTAITTVLKQGSKTYDGTVGTLEALASGTLLYIVVFGVLLREKKKEQINGLVQLTFVVFGYVTIYLFALTNLTNLKFKIL